LKNLMSVFLFTCFLSNVLHKMMLLNVIFYTHCKYTHTGGSIHLYRKSFMLKWYQHKYDIVTCTISM
jgi:hypothetical protein